MAKPISAFAQQMREKFWFDPLTDKLRYTGSNAPAQAKGDEWRVLITQNYTLPYSDAVYLYMNGRLRTRETLVRVVDRKRKPLSRLAKKRIHRLRLRNARERQEQLERSVFSGK